MSGARHVLIIVGALIVVHAIASAIIAFGHTAYRVGHYIGSNPVTAEDLTKEHGELRDKAMRWCAGQGGSVMTFYGLDYAGCAIKPSTLPAGTVWDLDDKGQG